MYGYPEQFIPAPELVGYATPKKVVSYETGAKGTLFGDTLSYGLTLFWMDVEDLQLQNYIDLDDRCGTRRPREAAASSSSSSG